MGDKSELSGSLVKTSAAVRWAPVFAAAVLLAAVVAIAAGTRLSFPPAFDAGQYHIPGARSFYDRLATHDFVHYRSATPPLPHILWALAAKVAGFSPAVLRVVSLAFGVAAWVAFFVAARRIGPGGGWRALSWNLIPYVFWLNFTVMTEPIGFAFGFGCLALLGRRSPVAVIGAMVAAAAALYCRLSWLCLPAGALLYLGLRLARWWERDDQRDLRDSDWMITRVGHAATGFVPVACLAPLLLYWGGLTPPVEFSSPKSVTLNPMQIVFLSVVLGCYAWGWGIGWAARRPLGAAALFTGSFIAAGALLHFQPISTETKTGLILSLLGRLETASFVPQAILALLAAVGAIVIARTLSDARHSPQIAMMGLCSLALTCLAPQLWERYHLTNVAFVLLLMRYRPADQPWLGGQLFGQTALTASFVYYQLNR